MPEVVGVADPADIDGPLLSPQSYEGSSSVERPSTANSDAAPVSEGEDVADRAASLLQGLRGDADGEGPARDDSLRVRRRRESADDERTRRRRRRVVAGSRDDTAPATPIAEEGGDGEDAVAASAVQTTDFADAQSRLETPLGSPSLPSPPITIVSPPSPARSEFRGVRTSSAGSRDD